MTQEQKISYALGANVGESFKTNGITIDFNAFKDGFLAGMEGKNQFTPDQMNAIFQELNQMIQSKQNAGSEEEKAKGQKFLDENKTKDGVVTLPSGLQYKVITMGTGAKPLATDVVKVHYHGTTIDGTVFDSSVQRGEPISFALNQVIPGWTEGVQLMPVGSKFMFFIPSNLAYGDQGAGGVIKPGSTLIFEVELLGIETK
ncbi:MAG TPA: FKBP-type peptidyl-prolyl cis-trans isomerase [Bacteroidales bacterium]|nr:FKBP-type peptidyl-prolyl cis-trans isomerase [Bacteroidales bacterium]HPS72488.1 FKBP-type peptidyl-prolyl cis-trans isomerase [Bacteroidales bacterium]